KIYKGKEGMTGIDETKKQIDNKTLGSFLNTIYTREGEPFKLIVDENGNELRVRARYTLRDMYIKEFEEIWNRQAKNLQLIDKQVKQTKNVFLKGSLTNKRNKNKIETLYKKYGKEQV